MNNFLKKTIATAMAVGTVGSFAATSALASNVTSGDDYIANDYLKIFTRATSGETRFYIDTTGGNPDIDTDDDQRLLYHITSDMFVSVDGAENTLRNAQANISAESGSITNTEKLYDIDFTQKFSFMKNKINGRDDVVEIKFTATNNTTESHKVGVRTLLDTMLGDNDQAPFRVAGIGAVTTRMQFEGDQIPVSYQAFDNLANPTVVSTGSFATGEGRPDIVQFNNFFASNSIELLPGCDVNKDILDSAVNAIWTEKTLAPGESRDYVVYYGIGEVEVQNNSELVLGATRNESAFEINEDGTAYKPVTITGYLKNAGNSALNNVSMSIDLPQGVTLAEGEQSVQYASIASNEEQQNTWTLNAAPSGTERTVTVTVNAASNETGTVEPVVYTYTIPAIENAPTEPETEPTEPQTEPETEPQTTPTEPTEPATTVTEPATTATQPTTQKATQTATVKATTVTTTTTTTTTSTPATTSTGKVATGDSTAVLVMLAGLLTASGVVAFALRRKNSK